MKLFRKAMLAVITMVLAVVAIVVPANRTTEVEAANIPASTKLYLKPSAYWKQSNARFAAYFFGNGDAWVSMTLVAGETDIYEVTSPAKSFANVIFCRMNPSAAANNWNNKWNQTSDLTWNGSDTLYTVKEGTWDKGGGTWSAYPPQEFQKGNIVEGTNIYFTPNETWRADNAWFAAYFYDTKENYAWVKMEPVEEGSIIYTASAPAVKSEYNWLGYNLVRMNKASTALSWDSKLAQTDAQQYDATTDHLIGTDGNNVDYVKYYAPTKEVWNIVGSFNGWNTNDAASKLVYNPETNKYEIEIDLEAGTTFKVIYNNGWSRAIGYGEGIKGNTLVKAAASDGNIEIKNAGTYLISVANTNVIAYTDMTYGINIEEVIPEPEVTTSIAWQQGTLNDAAALRIVVILAGLTTENVADFVKEISIKTTHAGIADTQVVDVLFTGVVDLATGDAITGDLYAVLTYTNIPTGEYAIEVLFDGAVVATETATIA